jgi:hypothetical protein
MGHFTRLGCAAALALSLSACVDSSTEDGGEGGTSGAGGGAGDAGATGGSGGEGTPGCVPGRAETCACPGGTMGVQTCLDDRTFGRCVCPRDETDGGAPLPDAGGGEPECADGAEEQDDCADGGTRRRLCTDGAWDAWGPCEGGACEGDETEDRSCGLNDRGTSSRTCDGEAWGAWSPCEDPDLCTDGAEEAGACGLTGAGERTRICAEGAWGAWGECVDETECVDDAVERRACGPNENGRESRTCAEGAWGAWGECEDTDECEDGTEEDEACGVEGNGTRTRVCASGSWGAFGPCDDPDRACEAGSVEEVPCGLNRRGRQSHDCLDGRWGPFGPCADPDVCVDDANDPEACGLNGNGVATRTCVEGSWSERGACEDPDECVNEATDDEACGRNGRGSRSRTCAAGRWAAFGDCEDPDVCEDGAQEEEPCGPDDDLRTRSCVGGQWADWGPCGVGPRCPNPEDPLCPGVRDERCNGLDDDQDGEVDEGLVPEPGEVPDPDPATDFERDVYAAIELGVDALRARVLASGHLDGDQFQRITPLAVVALLEQPSAPGAETVIGYDGLDDADQALVRRMLAAAIEHDDALNTPDGSPYAYETGAALMAMATYLRTGGPDDVEGLVPVSQAVANGVANTIRTARAGGLVPPGGWNYISPSGSADLSTTHFMGSGLLAIAGDDPLAAPALEATPGMVDAIQDATDGEAGLTYRSTGGDASTPMTAVGLWMWATSGRDVADARFQRALEFLDGEWQLESVSGPYADRSEYYTWWVLAKLFRVLPEGLIDGRRDPAALGYAAHPRSPWFDHAYTILQWQNDDGTWGSNEIGEPNGWSEVSNHVLPLLALERALGGLPEAVGDAARTPSCADGRDNDRDGDVDGEDADCLLTCQRTERPRARCSNGIDDDADGLADFPDDPGCLWVYDDDEADPACSNQLDDDRDGRFDYPADPGCEDGRDGDETDPEVVPECGNGVDDDGDGAIDFPEDAECYSAAQDAENPLAACGEAAFGGPLPRGDSEALGDTGDGVNALAGGCGGVAGRELVYTFSTDGPERIVFSTVHDETEVDTVLYVRSACGELASEQVCVDDVGDDPRAALTFDAPGAGVWFLVVDARIGRGAYRLTVERSGGGEGVVTPACTNGLDDDFDGRIDLEDPGCTAADDADEADPDVEPACANGEDDDGDGLIDLAEDPGCSAAGDDDEADPASPAACGDGVDNDADGQTDWPWDRDCTGPGDPSEFGVARPRCSDGFDNDNDGRTDFPSDPGCHSFGDGDELDPEARPVCWNDIDDDRDGLIDYPVDPGCRAASWFDETDPQEAPACANGVDDDEDGLVDFGPDPGCTSAGDEDEADDGETDCANERDDDFDGQADWPADLECESAGDDSERGGRRAPACADGIDNDEDGLVDLRDDGCEGARDNDEADPLADAQCSDGVDNDEDGDTDWPDDADCEGAGGQCEAAGFGLCDGACIDLSEDADNCGACGFTCPVGVDCEGGYCGGLVRWEGVRTEVPAASLDGWQTCYSGFYDGREEVADILEACDGRMIMYACRPVGAADWTVAAMGERQFVFADTGDRNNDLTLHNGVGWYFSDSYSMGFVPEGEAVARNSCDTLNGMGELRLCWHTSARSLSGGYRCGARTGLNGAADWERAIFHAQ